MNQDILSGKWKQMRGQVKQWWGRLSDDDLDQIDGAMDKLAGALQERYGWAREQAEREIKKRFEQNAAERLGDGT
ncbi:MAG: CsbD family protein [Candidatus Rokuibacteriota bacterium]|nr:MAG: CsbD family protein [Candidatus Rokubacteria bacterium]